MSNSSRPHEWLLLILAIILMFSVLGSDCDPGTESKHFVSDPNTPTGPSTGDTGESLVYETGGSTCSKNHPVEYRFEWGDGNTSSWGSLSQGKIYHSPGTYSIKAQARCTIKTSIETDWSSAKSVSISSPHTVNTPTTPSGPSSGNTGKNLSFSTGGSYCSQGHSVQYRFDWGDGSNSSWGSSDQSKSYSSTGTYTIKAQARCAMNESIISAWSDGKSVKISRLPTRGLIAYYSFENNANDMSGNGNNGTVHGAALTDNGKVGRAYSFDGIDDYITMGNNSNLRQPEITIAAWIKPNDVKSVRFLGNEKDFRGNSIVIQLNGSVFNFAWRVSNGGSYIDATCSDALNQGVWYHVAGTFDGSTSKIYINGNLKDSVNITKSLGTWPFTVGAHPELNVFFKGIIDELYIYNRALSQDDIRIVKNN